MAVDSASPRTRRALLAAALGAGVATLASALGRPMPADAATGSTIHVGDTLTAPKTTTLSNSSAVTILSATSPNGIGLYGESVNEQGVSGYSSWKTGVLGASYEGQGVIGVTGMAASEVTPRYTGVAGYASLADGSGVYGEVGDNCYAGVDGYATNTMAVHGYSVSGTGGHFETSDPKRGYALRTIGRVRFDKSIGVATVASGSKSVTVTPGIDLTTTAAVVATLQGNPGGTTTVQRVSINPTANTFTIYLTANSTATVKVAWHVFG